MMGNLDMIEKLNKILIVSLLIVQFLDMNFTYFGILNHGSVEIEGNPLVKWLCYHLGAMFGLSLVKSLALFVLSYAYHTESLLNSKFLFTSLFIVSSFYLYVMFCWSYYFLILV